VRGKRAAIAFWREGEVRSLFGEREVCERVEEEKGVRSLRLSSCLQTFPGAKATCFSYLNTLLDQNHFLSHPQMQ
jgi:hypothetical protein